jgi:hypothetical protein
MTTDIDMLNYALTLEHLEYAFYRDGLDKFGERKEDLDDLHRRIAAASSVSPEGDGGARRR